MMMMTTTSQRELQTEGGLRPSRPLALCSVHGRQSVLLVIRQGEFLECSRPLEALGLHGWRCYFFFLFWMQSVIYCRFTGVCLCRSRGEKRDASLNVLSRKVRQLLIFSFFFFARDIHIKSIPRQWITGQRSLNRLQIEPSSILGPQPSWYIEKKRSSQPCRHLLCLSFRRFHLNRCLGWLLRLGISKENQAERPLLAASLLFGERRETRRTRKNTLRRWEESHGAIILVLLYR